MKQPTYQQISELYKELWQLQRDYEELEKKCKNYKDDYLSECQYTDHLMSIITAARDALNARDIDTLRKELNKV